MNKISIFVSLIRTQHGTAKSVMGVEAAFDSWAVPYDEYRIAFKTRENFNYILPHLSDKPGGPGLLDKIFFSDIDVNVKPSVINISEIPELETIISVGGTTYNLVSEFIQSSQKSKVKITDKIYVDSVNFEDGYTGFIQRICDERGRYLFYVAGLSTFSSTSSLEYLIKNWKTLHKQYRKKDFLVMIKHQYPKGQSSVIFSKDW